MLITHDTRCALDAVVDLVNTAPEDHTTDDGLADVASLADFVRKHEISDVGVLSEYDLAAVHKVRGKFAGIFAAGDPRVAAALINELVATAGTTPRLTDHDGYDWHVHYFAPGASVADHLAADCGMALAFFVVAGEQERLRRCEAPTAGAPSSTCPATGPAATATAAPAETASTWPRTAHAARKRRADGRRRLRAYRPPTHRESRRRRRRRRGRAPSAQRRGRRIDGALSGWRQGLRVRLRAAAGRAAKP